MFLLLSLFVGVWRRRRRILGPPDDARHFLGHFSVPLRVELLDLSLEAAHIVLAAQAPLQLLYLALLAGELVGKVQGLPLQLVLQLLDPLRVGEQLGLRALYLFVLFVVALTKFVELRAQVFFRLSAGGRRREGELKVCKGNELLTLLYLSPCTQISGNLFSTWYL